MAIFHLHVKNIGRRDGRSAVAAAAYRAGVTLPNEAEERVSAFGGRRDVLHSEIRAPVGAPQWSLDRAALWNAVEAAEKRKDARLAKEIEFAIPRQLPRALWRELACEMADAYTARGHVVDLAIHDDGSGHNPHVHMMLTPRALEEEGFGRKLRDADNLAFINDARALWARIANAALAGAGAGVEIDARSHAARGEDITPGKHRGPNPVERRARRVAARTKGAEMNYDTFEARQELLADKAALERFPLLRARPDWPPEDPTPAGGLKPDELREHKAFWQEIYRRQLDPDREPDMFIKPVIADAKLEEERPRRDIPAPVKTPDIEPRYEGALRLFETTEQAAAQFAALERALAKAEQAQGREPLTPRSVEEWRAVLRASNELKATIAELRAEGERNRAFAAAFREKYPLEHDPDEYPVPAPDGSLIAPSALERAQDEMIAEVERPAHEVPQTPRPERQAEPEERGGADDNYRRFAWLYGAPAEGREEPQPPPEREPEWLRKEMENAPPERAKEPEPER